MRIVYGVILALVLLAVGGVIFVYSGAYNVAASDQHSALGGWALNTTMENSIRARADAISVPDLDNDDMIAQGAQAYDAICAVCHLKPGLEDTVLRAGLNPMPPALAEQSQWGPAEQFWIVKHGIKMTGMPAWGETHKDQELWEIVAFLQKLPELSAQQYTALLQPSGSSSGKPADDGHDHEHGNTSGMMGSSSTDKAKAHQDDGHDHEHGNTSGMMGSPSADKAKAHQDDGHDHEHGDTSGMMGTTKSGNQEETSDSKSTPPAQGEAESDDHYADGHTH